MYVYLQIYIYMILIDNVNIFLLYFLYFSSFFKLFITSFIYLFIFKYGYYIFILLYLYSFFHYLVSFSDEEQNLYPLIGYLHSWAPLMCAFIGGCSVLSLFLYLVILATLYIVTVSKCARSYVWIQRFSFVWNRFSCRTQTSRSVVMHVHARINERSLFSRHSLRYYRSLRWSFFSGHLLLIALPQLIV